MHCFFHRPISYSLTLLFFVFLSSCGSNATKSSSTKEETSFHRFIKKFKVLSLPVKLDYDDINGTNKNYTQLDEEDTLFIKNPPNLVYGLLPVKAYWFDPENPESKQARSEENRAWWK
jgi:hypothetical protein